MIEPLTWISYTLVTDGTRDQSLLQPIIQWVIRHKVLCRAPLHAQIADFRHFRNPPTTLYERLREAVQRFPCNVLFVHRDAERQPREYRLNEIADAVRRAGIDQERVLVVPVQMTETWVLISEAAIRRAADNPNGKKQLAMPKTVNLEAEVDAKGLLESLLIEASEKKGRHLKRFRREMNHRVHRVAVYIGDYSPLECLPAFQAFERDTEAAIRRLMGSQAFLPARPD